MSLGIYEGRALARAMDPSSRWGDGWLVGFTDEIRVGTRREERHGRRVCVTCARCAGWLSCLTQMRPGILTATAPPATTATLRA